jgi:outer membrane receptor for ferrienterochelin and colicins
VKNIRVVYNLTSPFWLQPRKNKLSGIISSDKKRLQKLVFFLIGTKYATQTDSLGQYSITNIAEGNYKIQITAAGFQTIKKNAIKENENNILILNFQVPKTNLTKSLFREH